VEPVSPAWLTSYLARRKQAFDWLNDTYPRYRVVVLDAAIALTVLAAFVVVVSFLANLGGSGAGDGDVAQALGNVVGGALGAFGAFLVARWGLNAREREAARHRAFAASAMINAAMDRYYTLRRVADRLITTEEMTLLEYFPRIEIYELNMATRKIPKTIHAEFARYFLYEARELLDLDFRLSMASGYFGTAYRFAKDPGAIPIEEDVSNALAHLKVAAADWKNIVAGYALARREARVDDEAVVEYEAGADALEEAFERASAGLPKIEVI
jgi:hypothetical protein